jgi:hypothetical protein
MEFIWPSYFCVGPCALMICIQLTKCTSNSNSLWIAKEERNSSLLPSFVKRRLKKKPNLVNAHNFKQCFLAWPLCASSSLQITNPNSKTNGDVFFMIFHIQH